MARAPAKLLKESSRSSTRNWSPKPDPSPTPRPSHYGKFDKIRNRREQRPQAAEDTQHTPGLQPRITSGKTDPLTPEESSKCKNSPHPHENGGSRCLQAGFSPRITSGKTDLLTSEESITTKTHQSENENRREERPSGLLNTHARNKDRAFSPNYPGKTDPLTSGESIRYKTYNL
jgi:hypothetical protein